MALFCLSGSIGIVRAYLAGAWERETSVPVWDGHFVMQTSGVEFRQNQIRLQAKNNSTLSPL